MKVYFTASARGKAELEVNYRKIYDVIEELGHQNLDDLILKIDQDEFYSGTHNDQVKLFKQTLKYINDCDVVILEVSVHSLSMGYVLHKALDAVKPVVVLYTPGHQPYFALGIESDKLQNLEYQLDTVKEVLTTAIDFAEGQMDTRFNFFISPNIGAYLDWVAKKKRIPRAVYLRHLIAEDMKKEKEYSAS